MSRGQVAADIRALVDLSGCDRITLELDAEAALALAKDLERCARCFDGSERIAAVVRGAIRSAR